MKLETYRATRSQLESIALPEQTKTYKPIGHGQLIDLTLEGIHKSGFTLDKEYYSQARGGNVANGNFTLGNVADKDMQIQIAFQNSYDKSLTLKWAMGVHVFICSNGAISSDMGWFRKKHMGEVQIFTPHAISEYIRTAGEVFLNMQKDRDAMKQIELTKRVTAELLGRAYLEENFIESTQLNIIKRELKKPTFDYGAPNSLWELYQFVTYSMKDIHPSLWMDSHIDAHHFFQEAAGLIVPVKEPVQLTLYDEYAKAETLELEP